MPNRKSRSEITCCRCCGSDTRNKSRICGRCFNGNDAEESDQRADPNLSARPQHSSSELYEDDSEIEEETEAFESLVDMAMGD